MHHTEPSFCLRHKRNNRGGETNCNPTKTSPISGIRIEIMLAFNAHFNQMNANVRLIGQRAPLKDRTGRMRVNDLAVDHRENGSFALSAVLKRITLQWPQNSMCSNASHKQPPVSPSVLLRHCIFNIANITFVLSHTCNAYEIAHDTFPVKSYWDPCNRFARGRSIICRAQNTERERAFLIPEHHRFHRSKLARRACVRAQVVCGDVLMTVLLTCPAPQSTKVTDVACFPQVYRRRFGVGEPQL